MSSTKATVSVPARFAIATAFLSVMGLTAGDASAYDFMTCHDYAEAAVYQQQKNVTRGCGFSGPRWSSSYDFHFTRCVEGMVDRGFEYNSRSNALMDLCRPYVAPPPPPVRPAPLFVSKRCEKFAAKSVKQYRKSLQRGCGFYDTNWHGDHARHARWCAAGNDAYTKDVLKGRKVQLKNCKRGVRVY